MSRYGIDVWKYVNRYRHFFGTRPRSLDERRTPGLAKGWTSVLSRWLTVDPRTNQPTATAATAEREEMRALQARQYAVATKEFMDDPPEVVAAWAQRMRNETAWMSTEEYRKAKRNSLIASFAGVFISHTGFYPTKFTTMGVEFTEASRIGLCLSLIVLIWYLWAAYNMLLRDALVEDAVLTIEHKRAGIYKNYYNRWVQYILAQHTEKAGFYRRIPGILALYACVSLFNSAMRYAF